MTLLLANMLVILGLLSPLPLLLGWMGRVEAKSASVGGLPARLLYLLLGQAFLLLLPALILAALGLYQKWPLFGMQVGLLLGGGLYLRRGPMPAWPHWKVDDNSRALLAAFGVVGLLSFFRLLRLPTENFDALAYHLPLMAHWFQSGSWSGISGIGAPGFYPGSYEMLGGLSFFFPAQDLWVQWPGLWSWLLLGTAMVALGRSWMGASRRAALLVAALVLFLPDLLGRIEAIQPDTALAAMVLAGVFAFHRWWGEGDSLAFWTLGFCLALVPGLKYSGALQALILLIMGGLSLRFLPGLSGSRPRLGRSALLFLSLCFLVAASWYLRNFLMHGGLFPELDRELLAKTSLAQIMRPTDSADWKIFGDVLWKGFGPAGVALFLMGLSGIRLRGAAALLGCFLILQVLLYWNAPFGADNGNHGYRLTPWMIAGLRYGYLVPATLALLALPAVERLPARLLPVVALFAGLFGLNAIDGWTAPWLFASAGLVLLASTLPRRAWPALAVGVALVAGHFAAAPRQGERERIYGGIVVALEDAGISEVAVSDRQELARYLGRDWSRKVHPGIPGPNREWWITAGETEVLPAGWNRIWTGESLRSNEILWRRMP